MSLYQPLPETKKSRPELWCDLINEVRAFNEETHLGMANVWAHVHADQLSSARISFEQVKEQYPVE